MYVLSKNIEKYQIFSGEIFTSEKDLGILHGHVFVMSYEPPDGKTNYA